MKTTLLYGAPLRDALLKQVQSAVQKLPQKPKLAIVQVGGNPASSAYIRQKINAASRVGIPAEHVHLNSGESESMVLAALQALAIDPEVSAIIPQLPLPDGWDVDRAINTVPASKDVDGLGKENRDLRNAGKPWALNAATPLGVVRLLQHAGVKIEGQKVAVIGRGRVVGKPLRALLKRLGAEVIGIEKDTPHPQQLCREAAIVCAAAGAPGLVTKEWVSPGAVVIDIGLTRIGNKLKGDADAASLEGVAGILTPSPGGVGPLTVASLLTNVVDAAYMQQGKTKPTWSIPSL